VHLGCALQQTPFPPEAILLSPIHKYPKGQAWIWFTTHLAPLDNKPLGHFNTEYWCCWCFCCCCCAAFKLASNEDIARFFAAETALTTAEVNEPIFDLFKIRKNF